MTTFAQLSAAGVAYMFAVAAVGKLDGWKHWDALAEQLSGGRERVARATAVAVPGAEAVVVLATAINAPVGEALASVLLLVFAAGILVFRENLAGARCACFGAIHQDAVTPTLAVRNIALAVIAAAGAVASAKSDAGLSVAALGVVVTAAVAGALAVAVVAAHRQLQTFHSSWGG
jgi:hypothetical protein